MLLQDPDIPPVSMGRVFAVNSPEWLFMAFGCFCAIINGGIQPAVAIVFAEIIGVCAHYCKLCSHIQRIHLKVLRVLAIVCKTHIDVLCCVLAGKAR